MFGNFIVIEGIDGSGKSTQLKLLKDYYSNRPSGFYFTQEPTKSVLGNEIRNILKKDEDIDSRVLYSMFAADRINHILGKDGLLSKVESGINVFSDRYYFSNYAYQSLDWSVEELIDIDRPFRELLRPTLTIFLDVSLTKAMERINKRGFGKVMFENFDFLKNVRDRYLRAFDILDKEENFIILNADDTENVVFNKIIQIVSNV